ncbi:MAG: hypothetical protein LPK19_02890, partial [Hymenobacteraceae bacterium]|nr:hypothetical protein [Hymenobacteraceae bacterium]MDX5395130.1 hypothetical protein [Hymenobacteraceae bacterium]MDX5511171.1 hypothetical protein [Hymenobacteraceae bacterium]
MMFKQNAAALPAKAVLFVVIFSFFFSGCTRYRMMKAGEKQTVQVEPDVLALKGDVVPFEIKIQAPDKVLQKGYTYQVNVLYHYNDQYDKLATLPFVT